MHEIETWKPHWKRRSTLELEKEKAKADCLFDRIVGIMLFLYTVTVVIVILNDAFPHLFF